MTDTKKSATMKLIHSNTEGEMKKDDELKAATGAVTVAEKPKKVTKAKPKAEVIKKGEDLIIETAHKVENLSQEQAYSLAHKLIEDGNYNDFELGGVLSVIQSNKWYDEAQYKSFRLFVEKEFGFTYRKAVYLIAIYDNLVAAGIPWEKVKDLGWTKLRELASLLNKENVDEWVKAAKGMTNVQLVEYIKAKAQGTLANPGDVAEDEAHKTSTISFKVHADQKETINAAIEKAMNEANTDVKTVALEAICLNYLNNGKIVSVAPAAGDLKAIFKGMAPDAILDAFSEVFPQIDLEATFPTEGAAETAQA